MQVNKIIPFVILIAIYGKLHAATQVKISISNTSKAAVTISLLKYKSGALVIVDSLFSTDENIQSNLKDSSEAAIGLYVLSLNKKTNIELLLKSNETPELSGSLEQFMNHDISITMSVENEAYYKFLNATSIHETNIKEIELSKSKIPYYASNFHTQKKEQERFLFAAQDEYNRTLKSIQSIYAGTYTATEIIPFVLFPKPVADTFETNRSFLHLHYFDSFKNVSDKLIRHYLLINKIDQYFSEYIEKTDDKKFIVQKIYDNTQHNLQLQSFIFDYLLTKFYKGSDDNAIQALYTTWQQSSCSSGTTEEQQKSAFIESILKHKTGNTITNVQLVDNQNKIRSLGDVVSGNKITILVFWQTNCHSCEEQLPFIAGIYEKYKTKKLEIYAVSLDKDIATFRNTVEQKKYNWINVFDDKREAMKTYAVWQTPTLYVIDNTGRIIYKNIYANELEFQLQQLFK